MKLKISIRRHLRRVTKYTTKYGWIQLNSQQLTKKNVQSVGISDDYDEAKLDLDATKIKAYDSVTGDDVTNKFDITVNNGVITATLKAGFTKSLGDAENTQVIDTTKFEFGRYYKFDIPATVKADVAGGVDIENKANQIVHVYNPVSKSVETPEKTNSKNVSTTYRFQLNLTLLRSWKVVNLKLTNSASCLKIQQVKLLKQLRTMHQETSSLSIRIQERSRRNLQIHS